jgi:hypothetical protein
MDGWLGSCILLWILTDLLCNKNELRYGSRSRKENSSAILGNVEGGGGCISERSVIVRLSLIGIACSACRDSKRVSYKVRFE